MQRTTVPEGLTQTPTILTVPTGRIPCSGCAAAIEQRLRENPHVLRVQVDPTAETAHVEVEPNTVSTDQLLPLIQETCGCASPVPLPDAHLSAHHHAHTADLSLGEHATEAQAMAHAEHAGMAHAAHDMSDPRMAAAMEADMRRRFWISLVLALPVVAYSSLGMLLLGGRTLPTPFGVPVDWIMLAFATPVALWTSSVFHVGAYYALRSRVLNMSVLVSLGILTSYLFSVGLTLLAPGQETFYEAAVMLAVFLLFGHWMEMKARRVRFRQETAGPRPAARHGRARGQPGRDFSRRGGGRRHGRPQARRQGAGRRPGPRRGVLN
jgi:P-type Cu2+ transporter